MDETPEDRQKQIMDSVVRSLQIDLDAEYELWQPRRELPDELLPLLPHNPFPRDIDPRRRGQ